MNLGGLGPQTMALGGSVSPTGFVNAGTSASQGIGGWHGNVFNGKGYDFLLNNNQPRQPAPQPQQAQQQPQQPQQQPIRHVNFAQRAATQPTVIAAVASKSAKPQISSSTKTFNGSTGGTEGKSSSVRSDTSILQREYNAATGGGISQSGADRF
ncbi:hypothetical protein CS022_14800 [Veronia nyctiphanis]|uniref:Uncharacterized protein n=1 Tax=Veronia nyctiphanis TaxID=1278244 RepID=A0A4Q0YM78_9GAMM|nr:hypothetical protein [Veronia nyctiphanis]RXJ71826.1 hypothetical protein CS022_19345 [Veronia nyctiphanis]RXJ72577.1 hypothetical protein CS022_14800 [Veronia nyctiphanis]